MEISKDMQSYGQYLINWTIDKYGEIGLAYLLSGNIEKYMVEYNAGFKQLYDRIQIDPLFKRAVCAKVGKNVYREIRSENHGLQ